MDKCSGVFHDWTTRICKARMKWKSQKGDNTQDHQEEEPKDRRPTTATTEEPKDPQTANYGKMCSQCY